MASRLGSHLTKAQDKRRRLPSRWQRRRERDEAEHASATTQGLAVLGVAAAAAIIVAGVYYLPDFLRYMKIRRM